MYFLIKINTKTNQKRPYVVDYKRIISLFDFQHFFVYNVIKIALAQDILVDINN